MNNNDSLLTYIDKEVLGRIEQMQYDLKVLRSDIIVLRRIVRTLEEEHHEQWIKEYERRQATVDKSRGLDSDSNVEPGSNRSTVVTDNEQSDGDHTRRTAKRSRGRKGSDVGS